MGIAGVSAITELWAKIKASFAPISHTHDYTKTRVKGNAESSYRTGDVNLTHANLGTTPIANGGTGATTAAAARTSLGAQETLVSGTNIKTVNNQSLLGSGNISISSSTPYSGTPAMDGTASAGSSSDYARGDHVHPSDTTKVPTSRTVNGKALTGNITLTGSDIKPTAQASNSITNVLETFEDGLSVADEEISDILNGTLQVGNAADADNAIADQNGNIIDETYAPKASPALTGTPTAPTATAGTSTTQIATTAFVANAISTTAASSHTHDFEDVNTANGEQCYPFFIWDSTHTVPTSYSGTYPVSPCFVYYLPDNQLYYCTDTSATRVSLDPTGLLNITGDSRGRWLATKASPESSVNIGTSSNNGVNALTGIGGYRIYDKNGFLAASMQARTDSSGGIWAYMGVSNQKTDGSKPINNYIQAIVTKDGAQNYSVSNPTNFRSAIEAQRSLEFSTVTSSSFSLAANTYKQVEIPTGTKEGKTPYAISFNVSGTSTSSIHCMGFYVSGSKAYVKVRNLGSSAISSMTASVYLMWV